MCELSGRLTYRGIWQETVGSRGALAVSFGNTLKAALANLAYASILSDTLQSLLLGLGLHLPRIACLFLITGFAILPLCLLKNLSLLAPFSILGIAGIALTTISMLVRYLDGSYLPAGRFYNDISSSQQPEFGNRNGAWGVGILPFVCMVFEAYVMHYNSPSFYRDLKDRSLPRFKVAVSASFLTSAILYMAIASLGYLTFGGNSNTFILNNYSPFDVCATFSRLAVGLSTLMAYPLVFHGVRDGVMDIMAIPLPERTPERRDQLTYLLLSFITLMACFVTDLGMINAVGGGLIATAIVFVYPSIMFYAAIKKSDADTSIKKDDREVIVVISLAAFGVILGLVGAYLAVAGIS